ncbi:MAG: efflux RND transporter permease subunit, partial [Gemmatimonadota bacterium]|nr:efflux RND transporter permease subunit [Gemmatimonadota bacterium]
PFSMIISFIFLYMFDYTINMVTLMSLAIAIGMVVDDAIVVLENIARHVEEGEHVAEASIFGASEVGLAVSASALSVVAVFVPMMFITGLVGIMFKQLAFVVSITILASLFCSLTLIPMLSSKLLKTREQNTSGKSLAARAFRKSEIIFKNVEEFYGTILGFALHHKKITLAAAAVIFGGTMALLPFIGTDFSPKQDTGDINIVVELPTGTRLEETDRISRLIEKIVVEEVPEIRDSYTRIGQSKEGFATLVGQKEGTNILTVGMKLVPHEERTRSNMEIAAALRPVISRIPGINEFIVDTGDMMSKVLLAGAKPISVDITGYDLGKVEKLSNVIQEIFRLTEGTLDVADSKSDERPEIEVKINRDKAAALGLNTGLIASTLRANIYGYNPTDYKEAGDEFDIFLRLEQAKRKTVNDIENVTVPSYNGDLIKIKNIAEIRESSSPIEIKRLNQQRIITVGSDYEDRSMGDIAGEIGLKLDRIDIPLDINVEFSGQVEEQRKAFKDLGILLLLGIIMVYMVMASQFESLRDPFIITFSVPFAFVGIIWAFLLTGTTLNIMSFIGVIMLMGIAVKNAIVLIDYTNILRARGLDVSSAVTIAGKRRLRPVLMTSLTTIFGMLPMALSTGQGSEMWIPLGVTVIGGLSISMIVTLIIVPTIYHIFESRKKKEIAI